MLYYGGGNDEGRSIIVSLLVVFFLFFLLFLLFGEEGGEGGAVSRELASFQDTQGVSISADAQSYIYKREETKKEKKKKRGGDFAKVEIGECAEGGGGG